MQPAIVVIGAASNIGIKTYAGGRPRGVDRAPAALRSAGLVERIGARRDLGDLVCEPYRQFERLPGQTHHLEEVERYAAALADTVAGVLGAAEFPVVIGGDCSIVLGTLLGAREAGIADLGLLYLDGHADFASPAESRTGSAASMCLALATGRGSSELASLRLHDPLVLPHKVALVGRRDENEPWYGQEALRASGVLDLPDVAARETGYALIADRVLRRVATGTEGFWIHLDADVISSDVMSAVDSPAPGGAGLDELSRLLSAVVRHPKALGMELTIYDPNLDPDGACAERLVELLSHALTGADRLPMPRGHEQPRAP